MDRHRAHPPRARRDVPALHDSRKRAHPGRTLGTPADFAGTRPGGIGVGLCHRRHHRRWRLFGAGLGDQGETIRQSARRRTGRPWPRRSIPPRTPAPTPGTSTRVSSTLPGVGETGADHRRQCARAVVVHVEGRPASAFPEPPADWHCPYRHERRAGPLSADQPRAANWAAAPRRPGSARPWASGSKAIGSVWAADRPLPDILPASRSDPALGSRNSGRPGVVDTSMAAGHRRRRGLRARGSRHEQAAAATMTVFAIGEIM